MKTVDLNGRKLVSETAAQDYLFDMFDFPNYYGEDLEALYDALVDISEETHVSIINRNIMENSSYGSKLMWIFEDAASDNDKLYLDWTELTDDEY